ncbi:polymer-forming cytoskeletal protein [Bdellovibrionota bacterium FG-2]
MNSTIHESSINIISEDSRIQGTLVLNRVARIHGVLEGEVIGEEGSTLILGETSVVEGTVRADTLFVDGYVKGKIIAQKKVVVSQTGRVIGDIESPSLKLEPGAYFEGRCSMIALSKPQSISVDATPDPSPSSA